MDCRLEQKAHTSWHICEGEMRQSSVKREDWKQLDAGTGDFNPSCLTGLDDRDVESLSRRQSTSHPHCCSTISTGMLIYSAWVIEVRPLPSNHSWRVLSEKLKRDSEMCSDSFGVTDHSRGHRPSTDRAVRGVPAKDWHLHGITSVVYGDRPLFILTLARDQVEAGDCEVNKETHLTWKWLLLYYYFSVWSSLQGTK